MLGYKAALRGAINSEYKFKLKEIKSVISHPKVNEKNLDIKNRFPTTPRKESK